MMMAVWGILPSLSALGPLAFLALVAPAVFAVLSIWMRRWAAALTAASAMSAVYLVQGWWQPLLRPTWWSSRAGLWAVLGVIAAIAAGWALRRGNRFLPAVPSADSAFNPWWLAAIVLLSAGLIASVSASMPLALSVSLAAVLVGVTACAAYEFACRRAGRAGRRTPETIFLAGLAAGCLGASASEPFLARLTRSLYVVWAFAPADPGAFLSEPWVEGDRVFIAAAHQRGFQRWGAVYALDRWTGEQLWRFDNDGAMKPVASPPRLMDGKIIVGEGLHEDSSCNLFCLDAANGAKLWEYATSSHIEAGSVRYGDRVIFSAGDDGLRCVNLATGAEVWRLDGLHIDAAPTVSAGLVFVGSYAGRGPKPAPQCLLCLNALNGQVLWEEPADMSCFGPPAALDRRVFFGLGTGDAISGGEDPAGAVVVLDAVEGKWIWRADFADGVVAGPLPLGDNLIAVSRSGEVRSLSRDRGVQRWTVALGAPILGRPMFLRERGRPPSILLVTSPGRCVRLDSQNGRLMASDDLVRAAGADSGAFLAGPVAVRSSIGRQIFVAGSVTSGLTETPRLMCLMEHE